MTDAEYYADRKYLSNSMLGWLHVGPQYFRKRFDLEEEEDPNYLKFGTAVHCNILEPERFKTDYYVSRYGPPHNHVQIKYCDLLINTSHLDDAARLYAYKLSYSVKSKTDDQIATLSSDLYLKYRQYVLQERENIERIRLTTEEYRKINAIRNNIQNHPTANILMLSQEGKDQFIRNEFVVLDHFDGIPMKAKIDRLIIDFASREIIVLDLKTSTPKREDVPFKEKFLQAIDEFYYDRQAAVYCKLVKKWFKENYSSYNVEEFKIIFKFVACRGNYDNEVRVFTLHDSYMERGHLMALKLLKDYNYYETRGYTMHIDAAEMGGDEIIAYDNKETC